MTWSCTAAEHSFRFPAAVRCGFLCLREALCVPIPPCCQSIKHAAAIAQWHEILDAASSLAALAMVAAGCCDKLLMLVSQQTTQNVEHNRLQLAQKRISY